MKVLPAAVALLFFTAGAAYVTRAPATLSGCTYETSLMDRGTRLASASGSAIHSLNGPVPTAKISDTVRGTWRTLGFWVGTFGAAVQGRTAATSPPVPCGSDPCAPTPPKQQQPAPRDPASLAPSTPGRAAAVKAASRYWSGRNLELAVAIAGAESGWKPSALSPPNRNGSRDHGEWQINDVHRDLLAARNWRNINDNAWMAHQVWKRAGGRWTPWMTYIHGSYKRYLRPVGHVSTVFARPMPPSLNDSITPQAAIPKAPCPSPATPPVSPPGASTPPGGVTPDGWNFAGNNTVDQAVTYMSTMAQRRTRIPSGMCLHYVGVAYGQHGTAMIHGRHWAIDVFDAMPRQYKHPGMSTPPRGALVFWRTGGPGHIAISLGGGRIASTDFNGTRYRGGIIGVGPISNIDRWGKRAGWTAPWFRGQTRAGANA